MAMYMKRIIMGIASVAIMFLMTACESSKSVLYSVANKDNKWGFIDRNGNEVIPCKYDYADWFSEKLILVELNDKWGFIDKDGNEVVPCKYNPDKETYINFEEGFARVISEDYKCGFIDETGNEAIPCKYDEVTHFTEGLAAVMIVIMKQANGDSLIKMEMR